LRNLGDKMKQKDLPQRWQDRLHNYLLEIGSKYKELSAEAFQHNLKIEFADRSKAFFYSSFYWIDEESREIAVFTEHCGYHIFPLIGSKLETIDRNGNIIKTEDFIRE
jgi:hypothetical protein